MQDQSPEAMSSPPLPPREPRQTPTLLSRLLTPTILLLTSLTLALSTSYAVLAADILAYALAEARDSNYYMIELQTWWEDGSARETFRGAMAYTPRLFELGGLEAVMAVGMLAAVGSLVVGVLWVLSAWSKQEVEEDDGEGVVKVRFFFYPTMTTDLFAWDRHVS